MSPTITAWCELDPKKMERFGQEMTKATQALPGCGRDCARQAGADPNDPTWKLSTEGYPFRTAFRGQTEGTTIEVVTAENRGVPPTEFQQPADFKRQAFNDGREIRGSPFCPQITQISRTGSPRNNLRNLRNLRTNRVV